MSNSSEPRMQTGAIVTEFADLQQARIEEKQRLHVKISLRNFALFGQV